VDFSGKKGNFVRICSFPLEVVYYFRNLKGRDSTMTNNETDYFVVKAKENGVQVIGLTRGQDTRFHHAEKLDRGEVMIAEFTEHTSAVKVRGRATLWTKFGVIEVGDAQ
jgi:transcription attenuation protein (tryptophan RNA-binding attenuator protein)